MSDYLEVILDQLNTSPQLLIFSVVIGFVILSTYNFITLNEVLDKGVTTVFSSFIVGYLYVYCASLIPISFGFVIDCVGMLISSVVLTYLFVRVTELRLTQRIIYKLKIPRSLNRTLWQDMFDKECTMKIRVVMRNGHTYEGYFCGDDGDKSEMRVAMFGYKIIDTATKNVLEDYSCSPNREILLYANQAISIEVIYGVGTYKSTEHEYFLSNVIDEMYEITINKEETE